MSSAATAHGGYEVIVGCETEAGLTRSTSVVARRALTRTE